MGATSAGEQWNEVRFLEAIEKRGDEEELLVAKALLAWSKSKFPKTNRLVYKWCNGAHRGTLSLKVVRNGKPIPTFTLNTEATSFLSIHFERLRNHEPFDDLARRQEVLRQLKEKADIDIPPSQADKSWPSISFTDLINEQKREAVLEVLNSVVTALG